METEAINIINLPRVTVIQGPQVSGKSTMARFLARKEEAKIVEGISTVRKAQAAIQLYDEKPLIITTLDRDVAATAYKYCKLNDISCQTIVLTM